MKKLLNSCLALCATFFLASLFPASQAHAQRRTPRRDPSPDVTTKQQQPSPTPLPTPTPQPTPAAEPFDGASVERMAAQCVRLETEAGTIEMKMLPEVAPETVRNFLNLVATGAYDTTTFSRVVKNFVIQGGNLSTRENLTPELAARSRRTIPDEPNEVKHVRGVVSMARPASPNSSTTHFFILVSDAAYLNGTFAAFGRVTKGMEVVDAINKVAIEGEKPLTPIRVGSASVFACAAKPPAPAQ
ncbi:MAG TPA: peptidylprolyl isomerase [Pyrinomonadaceae bacterium]|jgi:peptidyl-prolyl cis-trans isomerase B (cyclophilin B)